MFEPCCAFPFAFSKGFHVTFLRSTSGTSIDEIIMAESARDVGSNRIMVFLRVKPRRSWYDEETTDLMDIQPDNKTLVIEGGKSYEFDWIWHGPTEHSADVFNRVARPVIDDVFTGVGFGVR
jgi:hypothetical protein